MTIPPRDQWKLLARYTGPHWRMFLLLALLVLLNLILQIVNPQIMRHYIDAATGRQPLNLISRIAFAFLGVELAAQVVGILEAYVASRIGWETTNNVRDTLVSHCLSLDQTFHKEHSPGEMIQRIDGDVSELSEFFTRFVVNTLGNGLLFCGVLVMLWKVDWRIDLLLVAITALSLGILGPIQRRAVPHWIAQHQAKADLFGYLEERLNGISDIRPNGATDYVVQRLSPWMRALMEKQRRASMTSAWSWTVIMLTIGAFFATGTAFGWYLYTRHGITIGTVYLIFHYTMMLIGPVQQMSGQMQGFQQAAASLSRVEELLQSPSRISCGDYKGAEQHGVSVEFDAVSFRYDDNKNALDNVSFTIPAGKTLGIVGRTGSGKSTLAKLLFRFHDPQSGVIRLDGINLRDYRLAGLRRSIGFITQAVMLVHGTLRDNITLFDPAIDDCRIAAVLEDLGLGDWFRKLPSGLDSTINTTDMAAGEAQIISLARVFLRDPAVVVLDEAASHMDPSTERNLHAAFERLLSGRTAIIIAHRLDSMSLADHILVLEGGRIEELGLRETLIADRESLYSRMLSLGEEILA